MIVMTTIVIVTASELLTTRDDLSHHRRRGSRLLLWAGEFDWMSICEASFYLKIISEAQTTIVIVTEERRTSRSAWMISHQSVMTTRVATTTATRAVTITSAMTCLATEQEAATTVDTPESIRQAPWIKTDSRTAQTRTTETIQAETMIVTQETVPTSRVTWIHQHRKRGSATAARMSVELPGTLIHHIHHSIWIPAAETYGWRNKFKKPLSRDGEDLKTIVTTDSQTTTESQSPSPLRSLSVRPSYARLSLSVETHRTLLQTAAVDSTIAMTMDASKLGHCAFFPRLVS